MTTYSHPFLIAEQIKRKLLLFGPFNRTSAEEYHLYLNPPAVPTIVTGRSVDSLDI